MNMWNDIEIFGGHYVWRITDGELEADNLDGTEVDDDTYESIRQAVEDMEPSYSEQAQQEQP